MSNDIAVEEVDWMGTNVLSICFSSSLGSNVAYE